MLANAKFPRLSFGRAKFFTSQPQFLQELGDVGLFLETEDDPSELKECVRRLLLKLSSQDTEIGALKSSLDEKSQAEQRATEKLQSLEADNQQYKDTLQVTQGQLRELEDQFAEWQSKLATQHQHEIDNLCKRLEAEANKSESEILQLARDNEALRKKNHQLNEKIQEFEETVAYVTKQCDLAEQDRHSFNTTVKEMVEKFDRESKKYRQEIVHVTKLRIDLQTKLSCLEQDYEDLKQSHLEKCTRFRDLQDENAELRLMVRSSEEMAKLMEDIALD